MKSRAVYMTYCLVTRLSLIVDRSVMLNEKLVSWCFAPSQPQRITSGLKTNVSPSPAHSVQKPQKRKILRI